MTDEAGPADKGDLERSPLDILNDKLLRLNALTGIGSTRPEPSAPRPSYPPPSDGALTLILETLVRKSETVDLRMLDIAAAIDQSNRAHDMRMAEAQRSMALCLESVERAPKVSLNLIRTVSTRLDQLEDKIQQIGEASTQPLREAIKDLEAQVRASQAAPSPGPADDTQFQALGEKLAAIAARLDGLAAAQGTEATAPAAVIDALSGKLGSLEVANTALERAVIEHLAQTDESRSQRVLESLRDNLEALTKQISGTHQLLSRHSSLIGTLADDMGRLNRLVEERHDPSAIADMAAALAGLTPRIDDIKDSILKEEAIAPLKKQLADLSKRVQAITPVSLAPVEAGLEALSGKIEAGFEAAGRTTAALLAGDSRLDTIVELLRESASQPDAGCRFVDAAPTPSPELAALAAGMAPLREQLDSLSRKVEAKLPKSTDRMMASLESKLGAIIDLLHKPQAEATIEAMTGLVEITRKDIKALHDATSTAEQQVLLAIDAQNAVIGDISGSLMALQASALAATGSLMRAEPALPYAPLEPTDPQIAEPEPVKPAVRLRLKPQAAAA